MRILICICLVMVCSCSWAPRETQNRIRDQHVVSKVLASRLDTEKEPTNEQLKDYVRSSSQAWEAMDRQFNNYKSPSDKTSGDGTINLDKLK